MFVELLCKVFDGVARAKNMFAFSEAQAAKQMHYRTFMVNLVWPPKEGTGYARTYAELLKQAGPTWDAYEVIGSCRRTSFIASFHMHFDVAFRRCCGRNKWVRTSRSRLGNFNGT